MKKVLAILGQILLLFLFLALFIGGSFLRAFGKDPFGGPRWFVNATPLGDAYFNPTGLFLMLILYLLVLAIEAASKRIRTAGLWTTVVFVLALGLGLLSKFGFYHPS